jgi:hypothetical protein
MASPFMQPDLLKCSELFCFQTFGGLGLLPAPLESRCLELRPSAQFDLAVALTTIYRPALSRLERHFTFFSTLNTYCGVHLAARPVPTEVAALGSPRFAANRAALGFVGISLVSIELLLISGKGECVTTVRTLQRFVCEPHWMTSFLIILG